MGQKRPEYDCRRAGCTGRKGKSMDRIAYNFASAVYKARIARGLSQEKAAERAGISTGWYQRIEKGSANTSWYICVRLAAALGFDLNQAAGNTAPLLTD